MFANFVGGEVWLAARYVSPHVRGIIRLAPAQNFSTMSLPHLPLMMVPRVSSIFPSLAVKITPNIHAYSSHEMVLLSGRRALSTKASSLPKIDTTSDELLRWPKASDGRALLKGMSLSQLERWVVHTGGKPSRAMQLWAWLYQRNKLASSTDKMRESGTVSQDWCDLLDEHAHLNGRLRLTEMKLSKDGTRKLLFQITEGKGIGRTVEAVLIPAERRLTLCVSSQVGCAMNCQFCLTGRMGLVTSLDADMIVEQVVTARRIAQDLDLGDLTNVVFMGMGEPMSNIDAVLASCNILVDTAGLALSRNKVTVSTSGLVPQMQRFCRESPASLAVSLNATTDEVRDWLMPVNRRYNLETLFGALRGIFPREGRGQRHAFLEYIMLKDINDSAQDAERLVRLTEGLPCKINLITFNPHDGAEFIPSPHDRVRAFHDAVAAKGRVVTIRHSRGDDESAACGQLGITDLMADPSRSFLQPLRPPSRSRPPKHLEEVVMQMRAQHPIKV